MPYSFVARQATSIGDCVMRPLIHGHEWDQTALGNSADWPAVLHSTVRLILQSSVPMVMLWGEEGTMIYNDAYIAFAGDRHPQLLGRPVREAWPEVADFCDEVMQRVLHGETLSYHQRELTIHRYSRSEQVWIDMDFSPFTDENDTVLGVLGIVVETTDKYRANQPLTLDRTRLKAMFDQAPGFMALLNGPDHVYEMVNQSYLSLVGQRNVIGRTVADAIPETVEQGFIEILDQVYQSGEAFSSTSTPIMLDDSHGRPRQRYIDLVYQPLRNDTGTVFGIFVEGSDVTDRVAAGMTLALSEAKFRAFSQAMSHQVWTANVQGELDWFNENVFAYSGMHHANLEGSGWGAMVHPEDLPAAGTRWAHSLTSGELYEVELRLRRADGIYRWHLTRAMPLRDADNSISGWIGTNTDIETQKNSELSLAELNVNLEEIVAARTAERDRMWRLSTDVMLVADFSAKVEAINPGFTNLLGWEESEILGKDFLQLIHPDDLATTLEKVSVLGHGSNVYGFTNRYRCKDGSYRVLSWSAAPNDRFIHAIGRDVTAEQEHAQARRQAELALQQSQKMETLGKLTGGVAHDFNNLLQVISGNLQLLELGASPERSRKWIGSARSAVEKGAKLASHLLAFGRRQPLEPKVVKIGRLIVHMEELLQRALGEEIETELVLSASLWNTEVDVTQLENAVLNLAINARDAMNGLGKLTIEANNAVLDDVYCRQHDDLRPGQYVMLAVTDTGCGMSPEVVAQAFEPFFSTKEVGKGSGLGLSMLYGFAKQSGGHVKIYSEVGHGTTVRLYLPRSLQQEELIVIPEAPEIIGGTETILVAEDDEAVRTTVVEILSQLGYRILTAPDAASALAVIESGIPVDLLFTDVVMPGALRSPELARLAKLRLPDIAVLFTSGYTENAIVHGGRLDAGVELLGKPYTRATLARRIRKILDSRNSQVSQVAPSSAPIMFKAGFEPSASLSIVLIEDERDVRESTESLLEHLGHRVQTAVNGPDGLKLISNRVDMLITDLGLPCMSGSEVAKVALERVPSIGVVFATGLDTVDGWPNAILLRKPYRLQDLRNALDKVVAARAGNRTQ
jgi:PAS domain S-box-containing protein